jgi:hypothetical protein
MTGFLKRLLKRDKQEDEALDVPEYSESDPNSPYAHNQKLYDALYRDIETDALPAVPQPSKRQVAECEKDRRDLLQQLQEQLAAEEDPQPWGVTYSLNRVQTNQEIPVEVELWVKAICEHYLHDAVPMFGMVHWEQGTRKRLYESRGYTWYTISEIYPTTDFD